MALKKTRRQLSLALQSSPFTSASACDIHCAPLPAPPPQFAPVNAGMQSLSHTWVWEDLNLGPLGDRALVTRNCPCPRELHRGSPNSCKPQQVPVHGTRPRPEPLLPVVCSSSSSPQRCPGWTWGDASPRRPHEPWRGSLGAQAAGRLCLSHSAAEHRPAPPTSPHLWDHVTVVLCGLLGIVVS